MKNKIFKYSATLLLILFLIISLNKFFINNKPEYEINLKTLNKESYYDFITKKDTRVVMFGRASCKYCSVVLKLYSSIKNKNIKLFYFDLEDYYKYPEYEMIKSELGFSFVPTFLYIDKGEIKYTMNNPLDWIYDFNIS